MRPMIIAALAAPLLVGCTADQIARLDAQAQATTDAILDLSEGFSELQDAVEAGASQEDLDALAVALGDDVTGLAQSMIEAEGTVMDIGEELEAQGEALADAGKGLFGGIASGNLGDIIGGLLGVGTAVVGTNAVRDRRRRRRGEPVEGKPAA